MWTALKISAYLFTFTNQNKPATKYMFKVNNIGTIRMRASYPKSTNKMPKIA